MGKTIVQLTAGSVIARRDKYGHTEQRGFLKCFVHCAHSLVSPRLLRSPPD